MPSNLYFIENQGCDARTCGLARISDEEFPNFKQAIENINKNSYYGCMPVISVYNISMDQLKEIQHNPNAEPWDDDYIDPDEVFYLDDKIYTFADKYFNYYSQLTRIIDGESQRRGGVW